MNSSATVAALPSRRRRVVVILIFWLAAAALIGGQYLLLRYLGSHNRELAATTGQFLVPSLWWRICGTFLPLLLIGAALALQRSWLGGVWNEISNIGLVILVPFAALCLSLAYFMGLRPLDSVQVPGGGLAILALEDQMFTDVGIVLVEPADPNGFVWRRISYLAYIDGGPFDMQPQLVTAPDRHWLLVRRGGIWTDVFLLVDSHVVPFAVPLSGNLRVPDDATFWRMRSARIAALTGLQP